MPIYGYECPACDCKFEVKQGYNDQAETRCPKCKTVCRRVIFATPHYWRNGVPN